MRSSSIYGFLPLYKQRGSSSNQEIQFLKDKLSLQKVGHAGTLDPLAEGVLPVLVNRATRTMRFFLEYSKSYRFTIQFGISTDTLDITGRIRSRYDTMIDKLELERVLDDFKGEQRQKTPDFSARKYKGRSLYSYARQGISVPKPEKIIKIEQVKLIDFNYPFAQIETRCSSGTYIRQMIEDICVKLNTIGTLYSLVRTSYGIFTTENTKKKEDLSIDDILSIKEVFFDFGRFEVKESIYKLASNGSSICLYDIKNLEKGVYKRYIGLLGDKIIGIYRREQDVFYPEVVLVE
ncbi:MAG: tRNA pseudouridine(55) synthase TruB [Deltaproteobacteria bacterium]|nr:tRNA pseudouridine(55) synthase TruB [Deltaproteobacteria bacterium]